MNQSAYPSTSTDKQSDICQWRWKIIVLHKEFLVLRQMRALLRAGQATLFLFEGLCILKRPLNKRQ